MYGTILVDRPPNSGSLLEADEVADRGSFPKLVSKKRSFAAVCASALVLSLFLVFLSSQSNSWADSKQEPGSSGSSSSTGESFDFYLMAMSWQPQYCYANRYSKYTSCESPDDYWKSHWTIHGLWPQFSDGSYPSSCSNEKASTTLLESLTTELEQYWPDVALYGSANDGDDESYHQPSYYFWRHEWSKHGTCTGLTPTEYFQTALAYQLPTPSLVGEAYGQSLSQQELLSSLQYDVVLRCSSGKYLQEVRACLTVQGQLMDCPSTLLQQGNCNQEYILIASFPSDQ